MIRRKHKINGEVRFPLVRIVGNSNAGLVISSYEASKIAEAEGKDLILISDTSEVPVVRIDDYNKFIYNSEKKAKESKKHNKKSVMKEINLSPNIADHDLGIKAKKASEFLEDNNKVKCTLILKGRQNDTAKQTGELVMLKFANLLETTGTPENLPKLEGTRWSMIIKPKVTK